MAIEEVYVGFDTPAVQISRIQQAVALCEGRWRLKYTHWHNYRIQIRMTAVCDRKKFPTGYSGSLALSSPCRLDFWTWRIHTIDTCVTRGSSAFNARPATGAAPRLLPEEPFSRTLSLARTSPGTDQSELRGIFLEGHNESHDCRGFVFPWDFDHFGVPAICGP